MLTASIINPEAQGALPKAGTATNSEKLINISPPGYENIISQCSFPYGSPSTSGKFAGQIMYNRITHHLTGFFYAGTNIPNQSCICTLPEGINQSGFQGMCGIGIPSNSNETLFTNFVVTMRIDGNGLYSSHSINSNVPSASYFFSIYL